jgi:hypothetical protein
MATPASTNTKNVLVHMAQTFTIALQTSILEFEK